MVLLNTKKYFITSFNVLAWILLRLHLHYIGKKTKEDCLLLPCKINIVCHRYTKDTSKLFSFFFFSIHIIPNHILYCGQTNKQTNKNCEDHCTANIRKDEMQTLGRETFFLKNLSFSHSNAE